MRKATFAGPAGSRLRRVRWSDLDGFAGEDHTGALAALARIGTASVLRIAAPPPASLRRLLLLAASIPDDEALGFLTTEFVPFRIEPPAERMPLLTGYYEPEVDGSLVPGPAFAAPLLGRPDDLVTFAPGERPIGADLSAGRWDGGALRPYPDREAIEAGALAGHGRPIAWVRDAVEAFLIHVQGSARLRLPDGRLLRLTYAGRNGRPYRSIGRLLIESGAIAEADMSLAALKAWLRADPVRGRAVMCANPSFIFFAPNPGLASDDGPIGGAGTPLSALLSIAVDRELWPYGLPFFVSADLPWRSRAVEPFHRLLVAEDTGSAIRGPARLDLFFGSGVAAGERAGDIRHAARVFVLLPRGAEGAFSDSHEPAV